MRRLVLIPLVAAAIGFGAPATALAQTNDQDGLVNVNLQDIALAIPVSVAVPISVAANVCNVSILSLHEQLGDATCTATSNSEALSRSIAVAMTDSGGGGANNRQSGLVNVNVQNLALAVPVSVAVPVGIAANVCNVSVLSLHQQPGDMTCDAETTSNALSRAIARALAG